MTATETTKPKVEKVGVLLVHGIGEQCQFEHLEGEARNIATALRKSAAKTNGMNVATALRELADKTNEKNLQEALEAAAQKIDKGNIATALQELAGKIDKGNIATALQELVGKIDKGNIATALQELVAKTPELTKFELAELAAKKLAREARTVQVVVNSFPNAAFGAKQETWQHGGRAPVMVEVYDYNHENEKVIQITQIYFHQVWWADLDEPTTLWSEIRFWGWGLSLWRIDGKFDSYLPGSARMKWPNNVEPGQETIGPLGKAGLFWVSLVILLILPVLSLLNFVLRGLLAFNIPRPDILSQFVGDVKLLQQEKRIGKGSLQDLSSPPRVTLRRRMIRGLVEMALRPYDRWYVLAHSQGTVLAFNGIMETAQSLPNYLTKDLWRRCITKSLIRRVQDPGEALTAKEKETMQPPFPSWRDKEYVLDRRELFKNLRGLLTYGSPLSKFAALWPAIVPLNNERYVFHKDFQWLNVYDPTDPVAGRTKPFQSGGNSSQATTPGHNNYKASEPIDIAYKAGRFHLPSHLEYLTFSKSCHTRLVDMVANWLVEGNLTVNQDSLTVANKNNLTVAKSTAKQEDPSWLNPVATRIYEIARMTMWVFAALLIGSLLSALISSALTSFLPQLSSYLQPVSSFIQTSIVALPSWLKWSIATVYLLGAFLTVGALIGGTRLLWVSLGLATLTTAVLAVFPWVLSVFSSSPQEQFLHIQEELLSKILTACFEGVFYIVLAAIVVFIIGIMVRLFVRNLGNL